MNLRILFDQGTLVPPATTTRLIWFLFFACGLASGCSPASERPHVIVGFDYNDAKKILSQQTTVRLYVETIDKRPDEKALIVSFTELDGNKRDRAALVTSKSVTITN